MSLSYARLVAATLLAALAGAACTPAGVQPVAPESGTSPASRAAPTASSSAPSEPQAPSPPPREIPPGEGELAAAVQTYENGDYKNAATLFQNALDLGLEQQADRARAHKYLAFVACVSNRRKVCRDEFRKAFDADPAFDLTAAEAGHPIWGPVFRSVKAEVARKSQAKAKAKKS